MPDWLLGLIEVALGFATYLAADLFWQCRNRSRFYQYGLQNYPFLKKEISWDTLRKSTPFADLMLSKGHKDYPIVILTVIQSERATSRKLLWRVVGGEKTRKPVRAGSLKLAHYKRFSKSLNRLMTH